VVSPKTPIVLRLMGRQRPYRSNACLQVLFYVAAAPRLVQGLQRRLYAIGSIPSTVTERMAKRALGRGEVPLIRCCTRVGGFGSRSAANAWGRGSGSECVIIALAMQ